MAFSFPKFADDTTLSFDIETVSYDDRVPALNPWAGHDVAGYALAAKTKRGKINGWYLPVRHIGDPGNLPADEVDEWIAGLLQTEGRPVIAHNLKFDFRFMRVARGIVERCTLMDTMALARLVNNVLPFLNLEYLGQQYCGEGKVKVDGPKQWCKGAKTEDYGRVPIRVMEPYAIKDAVLTYRLFDELMKRLPESSLGLWETEKELTRVLLDMEVEGVCVSTANIKSDWHGALTRMIELSEAINNIAGWEVDLGSGKDKNELLFDQLKITPPRYTATGRPSLTKNDLTNLDTSHLEGDAKHIGDYLRNYQYVAHFTGTYIEGYLDRIDNDNKVHPDLRQAGTKTGRLAAGNPNTQNIPIEAERFVIAPPGYAIVGYDYSQAEYRLFAHYTGDPEIMNAYIEHEDADFHQHLADMLGVGRQFAKTLNFSFLYGMGEKKLLTNLAAMLSVIAEGDRAETAQRMHDLVYASGATVAKRAELYVSDPEAMGQAARAIYEAYHRRFPSIRRFAQKVQRVAKTRRWVKNMCGRVYQFDPDLHDSLEQKKAFGPHRAVNYLIQGSCADLLRQKLVECHKTLCPKYGARIYMTVHDSVYFYVPVDQVVPFYAEAKRILEDIKGLRVPMKVDGSVSMGSMSQSVKLKRDAGPAEIRAALLESSKVDDSKNSVAANSSGYRVGRHGV